MIKDVHVSNPRYPSSGAGIQCLRGSFAQDRAPTPDVGDSVLYHSLLWENEHAADHERSCSKCDSCPIKVKASVNTSRHLGTD